MHVLILPSWYPRYDGDIEGSFFREQALALASSGIKVGVVFPDLQGPVRFFGARHKFGIRVKCDDGLQEVRSHGFNWFPRAEMAYCRLWTRHAKKALDRYVAEFGKPDIVHVHSLLPSGLAAVWFNRQHGVSYVVTEHSTRFLNDKLDQGISRKCKNIVNASRRNLAVSEVLASAISSSLGSKWSYIPNIVSNAFIEYPLAEQSSGTISLISVAVLRSHKRMDLIIEALAELRTRHIDLDLLIVGDGPARAGLEKLASELNVSDYVKFLGQVPRVDMPAVMQQAHILVSASEIETFGVTLVEGLALGLPIVATPSGGPQTIVTPAVGRLTDDWDSTNLADAIADVIARKDQFVPAELREHCIERYSEQAVSQALISIYLEVLREGR